MELTVGDWILHEGCLGDVHRILNGRSPRSAGGLANFYGRIPTGPLHRFRGYRQHDLVIGVLGPLVKSMGSGKVLRAIEQVSAHMEKLAVAIKEAFEDEGTEGPFFEECPEAHELPVHEHLGLEALIITDITSEKPGLLILGFHSVDEEHGVSIFIEDWKVTSVSDSDSGHILYRL